MRQRIRIIPIFLLLIIPVFAQQDPSLLTVDSLFTYRTRFLGPVQWQNDGSGYLAAGAEESVQAAVDVVAHQREVVVAAIERGADDDNLAVGRNGEQVEGELHQSLGRAPQHRPARCLGIKRADHRLMGDGQAIDPGGIQYLVFRVDPEKVLQIEKQ